MKQEKKSFLWSAAIMVVVVLMGYLVSEYLKSNNQKLKHNSLEQHLKEQSDKRWAEIVAKNERKQQEEMKKWQGEFNNLPEKQQEMIRDMTSSLIFAASIVVKIHEVSYLLATIVADEELVAMVKKSMIRLVMAVSIAIIQHHITAKLLPSLLE